jgi:histidyl-tRNA synthetase
VSEGTAKKEDRRKFQAVRGTRDILPPESALWNRVEQAAREVFAAYGFGEIRLPIFEETELFARSIGAETEVVSKEMYSFEDYETSPLVELRSAIISFHDSLNDHDAHMRFIGLTDKFQAAGRQDFENGRIPRTPENKRLLEEVYKLGRDLYNYRFMGEREIGPRVAEVKDRVRQIRFGDALTLRPEATASVVRAYIEHGMHTLPGDVKLYYIGPMFRRERPQKGRYRQFYQIGAEVLTPSRQADQDSGALERDARTDAEVIEMLLVFLDRSGLAERTVYVNSIGDRQCRPKYVEVLRAELIKVKDKLGADSQRRIETNPLRVLDSKLESEQAIIEKLPSIADHLCEDCRKHYAALKEQLKLRGIAYEENWRLVRGLDYYMRTTFEITAPGLGAQNAVCGGGRYDGLVELLGGPQGVKGIGFALGTDRLILALQEAGKGAAPQALDAYIAWMGANAYPVAVRIARTLRNAGFAVELPHDEMKFKKSLGLADRLGARFAVILGENEVAAGTCTVKRLADGTQQTIAEKELAAHLRLG